MTRTQLGAFVAAFAEVWAAQADAREKAKESGKPFSGWPPVFAIAALCSAIYCWQHDATFFAAMFFYGLLLWVASSVDSQTAIRAANRTLEMLRWKEFDLRFEWRAFGLNDYHLQELRRFWDSGLKEIDQHREGYEEWWARTLEHAARAR